MAVQRVAAGRMVRPVWQNEAGGVTFQVIGDEAPFYVKWQPASTGLDLAAEAERLSWAGLFTPVPNLIGSGEDEVGTWLVMTQVPGQSTSSKRWRAEPATAVRALGEGLRSFHDSLPAEHCPFTWSAEERVVDVRRRAGAGLLAPDGLHPDHGGLSVQQALDLVGATPPVDKLVVCQGDACAPNTLLLEDGHWSGHLDLGSMGVADRWADLAIATWSAEWNFGPAGRPTSSVLMGSTTTPFVRPTTGCSGTSKLELSVRPGGRDIM